MTRQANYQKCVIKVLKPVKKKKIKREIKILQNLAGGANVVALLDVVRDPQSKTPSLIFEYIQNVGTRHLILRELRSSLNHRPISALYILDSAIWTYGTLTPNAIIIGA